MIEESRRRIRVFTYRTTRGNQKRYRDLFDSMSVQLLCLPLSQSQGNQHTESDGKVEDETSTEHLFQSVSACSFQMCIAGRGRRSRARTLFARRDPGLGLNVHQ